MEHAPALDAEVPEQPTPGLWGRFRHWLGERVIRRMTAEAAHAPGENNGAGAEQTQSPEHEPEQGSSRAEGIDIDRIMRESEERHEWETRWEAGSTYGRHFPELVIGPQRYPPPSMWGKVDDRWEKSARTLDELDKRLGGFDGTRPPEA